ncbi:beta-galactosidase [Pelomonas sp. V22]|uniref:glycoside hydrolase family 35 protein n=1 Tax=Pelomonas sp. V22 TaxID=2822139 RepID=UPI0024A9F8BD|nr:glycoside hydrolase family 35 protein [Pelomonas sp. V22]MDI4632654.1 beta-galactosidase [Pelomonas sp. V22]
MSKSFKGPLARVGGALAALILSMTLAQAAPSFKVEGSQFMLDGKPFQIRSGEMHYPRVPKELWRDRFRKARAMGLNTITTYAFWSQHEPEPGRWDFKGQNDLRAYIKTAAEEGLKVILRPGPYVCAEVDFGGFPAWLLRTPGLRVRSMDSRYMAASARFLKRLAQEVGDLQVTRGGPILMLQVENEYGSYGQDHDYMQAMFKQMRDAGFDAQLFTSDGGAERLFEGGTLGHLPAVVNFGGGKADAQASFVALQAWRPSGPRMAGEYWAGWFDHWGEKHHTQAPEEAAATVEWMLKEKISFNLYMFHGGTSFGWLPGANYSAKEPYQPDTTSYDYDAALDEAGRLTPKYRLIRERIASHLAARGESLPPLVGDSPSTQAIAPFAFQRLTGLLDALPQLSQPIASRFPRSMEHYGQGYGLILYRKKIEQAVKGTLVIDEARDIATVLVNGQLVGTLERRLGQRELAVDLPAGATLDILVENLGRIGFGAKLDAEHKGITRSVKLAGQELLDWNVFTLPLSEVQGLKAATPSSSGPAFFKGGFTLDKAGDSFLDTRGWGRGQVWVNGHLLGRYWQIGPQQSLYLPGVWLRKGHNEVLVLSDRPGVNEATLQGLTDPVFETP